MSEKDILKIIEDEFELIYSEDSVKELSKEDVSEYKRGVIYGRISELNKIKSIIENRLRDK